MTETQRLTYVGPPSLVSAFAQMLREEDLEVGYTPPEDRPGWSDDVHQVVIGLVVMGATDAIPAAVRAARAEFREQFPHPTPTVSGGDDAADDNADRV